MINFTYEFYKMWDAHFAVPTFDFYFKVLLSEPNKERIVTERDRFGRIIRTKVL